MTSVFQSFLLALGRSQQARIVGAAQSSALSSDSAPFRSRGYLDEYLSVDQINTLLTSCAYQLLSSKKSSEAAMDLFSLADRHSEALEELCSRLSSAMSVSSGVTPEEKTFWLQTAEAFYNTHIKTGHSAVLSGLSRDNKLALVGYLETLLNLSVFLDLSHSQPAEALSIIDGEDKAFCDSCLPQIMAMLYSALLCCRTRCSFLYSAFVRATALNFVTFSWLMGWMLGR